MKWRKRALYSLHHRLSKGWWDVSLFIVWHICIHTELSYTWIYVGLFSCTDLGSKWAYYSSSNECFDSEIIVSFPRQAVSIIPQATTFILNQTIFCEFFKNFCATATLNKYGKTITNLSCKYNQNLLDMLSLISLTLVKYVYTWSIITLTQLQTCLIPDNDALVCLQHPA